MLQRVRAEFTSRNVIGALSSYVQIPNQSPSFDPEFNSNGLQEKALNVMTSWLTVRGSFLFFSEHLTKYILGTKIEKLQMGSFKASRKDSSTFN